MFQKGVCELHGSWRCMLYTPTRPNAVGVPLRWSCALFQRHCNHLVNMPRCCPAQLGLHPQGYVRLSLLGVLCCFLRLLGLEAVTGSRAPRLLDGSGALLRQATGDCCCLHNEPARNTCTDDIVVLYHAVLCCAVPCCAGCAVLCCAVQLMGPAHMRGCKCKRSRCVKKYCDCFDASVRCSEMCK
jgi:hypothetical protein